MVAIHRWSLRGVAPSCATILSLGLSTFVACGSSTLAAIPNELDASGGDAADSPDTADAAASSPDAAASPPLCPVVSPGIGAACTGTARCAYGDSPDPSCRFTLACESTGKWGFANSGTCTWLTCPTTKPAETDTCASDPTKEGGCWWNDGTYCACGYGHHWKCYSATDAVGCPKTVPLEGSACSQERQTCDYCGHYQSVCESGAWRTYNTSKRSCPRPD